MATATEFIHVGEDGVGDAVLIDVLVDESGDLTDDGRLLAEAGCRVEVDGDSVTILVPVAHDRYEETVAAAVGICEAMFDHPVVVDDIEGPNYVHIVGEPGSVWHLLAEVLEA